MTRNSFKSCTLAAAKKKSRKKFTPLPGYGMTEVDLLVVSDAKIIGWGLRAAMFGFLRVCLPGATKTGVALEALENILKAL